jgi:hypothetical protein
MISLQKGDLLKYIPTSTVGKVTDIQEKDGKVWVRLDFTDLYYDAKYLIQADPSEYIEVSYKERKTVYEGSMKSIEDVKRESEEVDISEFMPSGGG